jgi:thioredoxin 1
MDALLQKYAQVRHLQIEDGKGKPLGRSFTVKLWPTLVFMMDGDVKSQIVRPTSAAIESEFAKLVAVSTR